MGDRERSMYVSDVRAFAKAHPLAAVEGLEGAMVRAWIEKLDLAPKTIERKLAALQNYWGWIQAKEIAPKAVTAFHGHKLPRAKKDAVKRSPADCPRRPMGCIRAAPAWPRAVSGSRRPSATDHASSRIRLRRNS
jgi:hypothetical protein